MRKFTIVLLDKNPIHRNLVNYTLGTDSSLKIIPLLNPEELGYLLDKKANSDIVVLDYYNNYDQNSVLMNRIRTADAGIRVVFFTEAEDHDAAAKLLASGATDYIVKTTNLNKGISELYKNLKFICKELVFTNQ